MKALDRRHRWDGGRRVLMEPRVVHTCLVCGRTQSFELLIPDAFLDGLAQHLTAPNPYRQLFARLAS